MCVSIKVEYAADNNDALEDSALMYVTPCDDYQTGYICNKQSNAQMQTDHALKPLADLLSCNGNDCVLDCTLDDMQYCFSRDLGAYDSTNVPANLEIDCRFDWACFDSSYVCMRIQYILWIGELILCVCMSLTLAIVVLCPASGNSAIQLFGNLQYAACILHNAYYYRQIFFVALLSRLSSCSLTPTHSFDCVDWPFGISNSCFDML